jgi:hypothetical protein
MEKIPQKILSVAIFIIIILLSLQPIKNYDIWWHLKTGEIIYQSWDIPDKDIFSYTKAGEPWTNHEWLSQLIFYITYKLFGFYGPIILKTFVLMLSFFIIYKRNQLFLNGYFNVFSIAVIVMISHVSWLSRPLIFTFLFIPLILYILDLYILRDKKILWSIPLIMIVWVNLHGSFILGLLLLFLYVINALVHNRKKGVYLSKILAASIAATLINPNTYEILLYPLQYVTESVHTKYILEWQSPSFHTFSAFEGALLLSIIVLAFSKRVSALDIVLILLFTHLGLFAIRNTTIYALIVVPIIFKYAQLLVEQRISILNIPQNALRTFSLSFSIAFLVIGATLFGYNFYVNSFEYLKDSPVVYKKFPKDAAEYLLQNEEELSKYNMFNYYGWGGYLIWKLYPTYRVFVDGRADLYGDFIGEYAKVKNLRPEAPEILKKYNISLILIPKGIALDLYFNESTSWEMIYVDNVSVIYLRGNLRGDDEKNV